MFEGREITALRSLEIPKLFLFLYFRFRFDLSRIVYITQQLHNIYLLKYFCYKFKRIVGNPILSDQYKMTGGMTT